jgi:hypothetical protein
MAAIGNSCFGKAVSEEKIFRNQPIINKNCLWWPCLLTDRDEMSNLNRGPSIDASYQVKSSPLKPLCQIIRNLVGSIYGRSSIKIAHFVPIYKQTWLPQVIFLSDWLISKNLQELPVAAIFVNGSGQNEQSL